MADSDGESDAFEPDGEAHGVEEQPPGAIHAHSELEELRARLAQAETELEATRIRCEHERMRADMEAAKVEQEKAKVAAWRKQCSSSVKRAREEQSSLLGLKQEASALSAHIPPNRTDPFVCFSAVLRDYPAARAAAADTHSDVWIVPDSPGIPWRLQVFPDGQVLPGGAGNSAVAVEGLSVYPRSTFESASLRARVVVTLQNCDPRASVTRVCSVVQVGGASLGGWQDFVPLSALSDAAGGFVMGEGGTLCFLVSVWYEEVPPALALPAAQQAALAEPPPQRRGELLALPASASAAASGSAGPSGAASSGSPARQRQPGKRQRGAAPSSSAAPPPAPPPPVVADIPAASAPAESRNGPTKRGGRGAGRGGAGTPRRRRQQQEQQEQRQQQQQGAGLEGGSQVGGLNPTPAQPVQQASKRGGSRDQQSVQPPAPPPAAASGSSSALYPQATMQLWSAMHQHPQAAEYLRSHLSVVPPQPEQHQLPHHHQHQQHQQHQQQQPQQQHQQQRHSNRHAQAQAGGYQQQPQQHLGHQQYPQQHQQQHQQQPAAGAGLQAAGTSGDQTVYWDAGSGRYYVYDAANQTYAYAEAPASVAGRAYLP